MGKTILDAICEVVENANSFEQMISSKEGSVQQVSEYLGVPVEDAVLFCLIFVGNYERNQGVCLEEISHSLKTTSLRLLKYKNNLVSLCTKNLCKQDASESREDAPALLGSTFSVTASASECILDNRPLEVNEEPNDEDSEEENMMAFLGTVGSLFEHDDFPRRRRGSSCASPMRFVLREEEKISSYERIKMIRAQVPDSTDRVLLYKFCYDRMNDRSGESNLVEVVNSIYNSTCRRVALIKTFVDEKNSLMVNEFVEFNPAEQIEDATITITEAGLTMLLGEEAKLYQKTIVNKDLIHKDDIVEKELFYSPDTKKQIDMMRRALEDTNFKSLCKRLSDKKLPQGIAILLYGGPGTGKTESVYQIAKQTGRDIYHVDISETKSFFFGESQKRTKAVFRKYRRMCSVAEKSKQPMPILLFNEADGVISKRKDPNSSSVAQEENAIQNIILEEMENLKGVMIATTNLADNLDAAFERRFLFKVHIDRPTIESRKHIWMNRLKTISEDEAEQLASSFDLSGGEIDNIVRKIEIEDLISGSEPDFAEINEFCSKEKINGDRCLNIGFRG